MFRRKREQWNTAAVLHAGARGLVAAMAMTGMRTATANMGLLEQSPPEAIVQARAPRGIDRLGAGSRAALTELAHWCYGTGCGVLFGLLALEPRTARMLGPAYGFAIWAVFELAVAPLLGARHVRQRRVVGRLVIAADHALYGLVVGGWMAPRAYRRRGQIELWRRGTRP